MRSHLSSRTKKFHGNDQPLHRTRARTITALCFAAGVIVFSMWAGCARTCPCEVSPDQVSADVYPPPGQYQPPRLPRYEPPIPDEPPEGMQNGRPRCAKDADCDAGFCDRDACKTLADIDGYGANPTMAGYGRQCDSNAPPVRVNRLTGEVYAQCDGYVCLDGRCRSCQSDMDCRPSIRRDVLGALREAYLGEARCVQVTGIHWQPGAVCWPMAKERYHYENISGGTEICAKDPADAPEEKRVAAGQACLRDCDCLSAFCDRGICADSADLGAWNYGKGRCQPGPPHAPIDNVLTYPVWDFCAGYVCVEGRCRSCQSDAECQEGSPEYKCLPLYGLPGKRCGRPSEAALGPAPNRMGPPPMPRAAPRPARKE
jgi:hypothetical protein